MHHDSRNLRQNLRDRSLQCSRRGQQILLLTEIANHIHHTQLPNTPAALKIATGSTTIDTAAATALRQMTIPDTDEVIVGELESEQGVGEGCGQGQRPQRRLAETEIRNVMRKQAHCHTKAKREEFEKTRNRSEYRRRAEKKRRVVTGEVGRSEKMEKKSGEVMEYLY